MRFAYAIPEVGKFSSIYSTLSLPPEKLPKVSVEPEAQVVLSRFLRVF